MTNDVQQRLRRRENNVMDRLQTPLLRAAAAADVNDVCT